MKTSIDVLLGMLANKDLEIRIKNDRINQLITMYNGLLEENAQLQEQLAEKQKQDHQLGFKTGGTNEPKK